MDFKTVLKQLITAFEGQGIRYALMGGFAVGLWGGSRTTVDLDFLVNRDDMGKIDVIMQGLGYECRYRSENVTQYVSPLKIFGEVDFLHAFREASLQMLQRAEEKMVFGGTLTIKTLRPEDLIGLKLQAIKNNPERKASDLADIKVLMQIHKDKTDWSLVEKYFTIFDMLEDLEELKRQL